MAVSGENLAIWEQLRSGDVEQALDAIAAGADAHRFGEVAGESQLVKAAGRLTGTMQFRRYARAQVGRVIGLREDLDANFNLLGLEGLQSLETALKARLADDSIGGTELARLQKVQSCLAAYRTRLACTSRTE